MAPGPADDLAALERDLATSVARSDIEALCVCHAWRNGESMPVWDTSAMTQTCPLISADDRGYVARALRYMDLRGLVIRPVADLAAAARAKNPLFRRAERVRAAVGSDA